MVSRLSQCGARSAPHAPRRRFGPRAAAAPPRKPSHRYRPAHRPRDRTSDRGGTGDDCRRPIRYRRMSSGQPAPRPPGPPPGGRDDRREARPLRAATARRWTQLVYCPEGGTFPVTGGRLALCLSDLLAIVTGLLGQGVQAKVAREVFVLGRGGDHPDAARSGHCPTASAGERLASVPRQGQARSSVVWSGRDSSLGGRPTVGAPECRRQSARCGRRKARCGADIGLLRGREVPRERDTPRGQGTCPLTGTPSRASDGTTSGGLDVR